MNAVYVFAILFCFWNLMGLAQLDAYFRMEHQSSGKVAEAVKNNTHSKVELWDLDPSRHSQDWYIDDSSPHSDCGIAYFIRNRAHHFGFLVPQDPASTGYTPATFEGPNVPNILGAPCHNRWVFGQLIENWYTLRDPKLVLTLKDGLTFNGNDVGMAPPDGSASQKWICNFY